MSRSSIEDISGHISPDSQRFLVNQHARGLEEGRTKKIRVPVHNLFFNFDRGSYQAPTSSAVLEIDPETVLIDVVRFEVVKIRGKEPLLQTKHGVHIPRIRFDGTLTVTFDGLPRDASAQTQSVDVAGASYDSNPTIYPVNTEYPRKLSSGVLRITMNPTDRQTEFARHLHSNSE